MNPLNKKPFIIAEVGSNWRRYEDMEQNLQCARDHINMAAACGVSGVKFQLFTHKELYGVPGDTKYDLPRDWLPILANECRKQGVEFMCSAFSPEGYEFVKPFVNIHKISASESNDPEIWKCVEKFRKPILASFTSMSLKPQYVPEHIYPLLCVSRYPAECRDYGLGNHVLYSGISDHTLDSELAKEAIRYGATIFEKHFGMLFNGLPNNTPDGSVSVNEPQLQSYCSTIRSYFLPELRYQRRLKITELLKAGDTLVKNVNYGSFRSLQNDLHAAPPSELDKFDGKRVKHDMNPQDGINLEDIE